MPDRTTRCHSTRHRPPASAVDPAAELALLLDLLDRIAVLDGSGDVPVDGPALVALSGVHRDHLDVAVRDVPIDARCGSAGLFGITAPPGTIAVGMVTRGLVGRGVVGDGVDPGAPARAPASVAIAVHRRGGVRVRLADPSGATEELDAELASGVLVDGLHRVLGLPTPGTPPPVLDLLHGWWSAALLDRVAKEPCSIADAADAHPAADRTTEQDPRALATAARNLAAAAGWPRLRRAAACTGAAELAAQEADWMDDTMFARWMVEPLPTIDRAVTALHRAGATGTAAFVADVADAAERGAVT
jgi:hypothetical protein